MRILPHHLTVARKVRGSKLALPLQPRKFSLKPRDLQRLAPCDQPFVVRLLTLVGIEDFAAKAN